MKAIGLYGVSKRFRTHNCANRWLRREIVDRIRGAGDLQGWRTVLQSIDLEISRGETVALLGCNGSGKSTLLKLMAGIIQPTTGRVLRHGSIGTLLDIGTGFHDDLTGRENVFVDGAILGLPEKHLRAMLPELEAFAELQGFMDTPMRYYSSGMKARLGFAVAMSADPDVFLIDEILAVGDEGFRRKCFERLDMLVAGGRTIVIVSHDIYAVQRLCSRAVWIHDGLIYRDGSVDEVCRDYLSHYDSAAGTAVAAGGVS